MESLAPELLIHILQFVPTGSLPECMATCKRWNDVILGYDEALWRWRAVSEFQATPPCSKPDGKRHLTWKDVCKCQEKTNKRRAEGTLHSRWYPSTPNANRVLRVQPDQEERVIYCTARDLSGLEIDNLPRSEESRGLRSIDMDSGLLLFSDLQVDEWAHIEYSEGYLVATSETPELLVFETRKATLHRKAEDKDSAEQAVELKRGEMRKIGKLDCGRMCEGLSMVGRFLVTTEPSEIIVWDVPNLKELRRFPSQPDNPDFPVESMQDALIDDDYIFITCTLADGTSSFRIHSLTTGDLVGIIPSVIEWSDLYAGTKLYLDHILAERGVYECPERGSLGMRKATAYRTIPDVFAGDTTVVDGRLSLSYYTDRHLIIAGEYGLIILPDYKAALRDHPGELSSRLVLLIYTYPFGQIQLTTWKSTVAAWVTSSVHPNLNFSTLLYIPDLDKALEGGDVLELMQGSDELESAGIGGGGMQMTEEGIFLSGRCPLFYMGGESLLPDGRPAYWARSLTFRPHDPPSGNPEP